MHALYPKRRWSALFLPLSLHDSRGRIAGAILFLIAVRQNSLSFHVRCGRLVGRAVFLVATSNRVPVPELFKERVRPSIEDTVLGSFLAVFSLV